MSRLILLLVLALGASAGVRAQYAHLVPEEGQITTWHPALSPYYNLLGESFRSDALTWQNVARMVRSSGLQGREWLTGIERSRGDGFIAYSVLPDRNIWDSGYTWDGDTPQGWSLDSARPSSFERDSLALSPALAARVVAVWTRALLGSRYPEREVLTLDGYTAHFSGYSPERGVLSGMTHSPPDGTAARLMVELGSQIGLYARGEGVSEADLRSAADRLASQLDASR